jgi:hypothetical protein
MHWNLERFHPFTVKMPVGHVWHCGSKDGQIESRHRIDAVLASLYWAGNNPLITKGLRTMLTKELNASGAKAMAWSK